MKFLKKEDLQLVNGGYLSDKEGNPVYNKKFVDAQKRAEFLMIMEKNARGKDFEGKKAYTVEELRESSIKEFYSRKETVLDIPEKPKMNLNEKLKKEAMDFLKFSEEKEIVEKVNERISEFLIIKEFEDFGLFFEEGIVKLTKIYTMEEIVEAAKKIIAIF